MNELAYSSRAREDASDDLPDFASEHLPRYTSDPPANRSRAFVPQKGGQGGVPSSRSRGHDGDIPP